MRYQFNPRAHIASINIKLARNACETWGGAKYVREAYPIMGGGKNGPAWRGTNQPRTIAFTCDSDADAKAIGELYGHGNAFVWNISEAHYV